MRIAISIMTSFTQAMILGLPLVGGVIGLLYLTGIITGINL